MVDRRTTTTIFFVMHAEVEPAENFGCDSPLSEQGVARAQRLAEYMAYVDVDGGPNAIYATQCRRTQQTVAPLAQRVGLAIEIADPYDVVGFMQHVLSTHRQEIVLIATDADIIPRLIEELHGKKGIGEEGIAEVQTRDVFAVTVATYGRVKTLRLPYSE